MCTFATPVSHLILSICDTTDILLYCCVVIWFFLHLLIRLYVVFIIRRNIFFSFSVEGYLLLCKQNIIRRWSRVFTLVLPDLTSVCFLRWWSRNKIIFLCNQKQPQGSAFKQSFAGLCRPFSHCRMSKCGLKACRSVFDVGMKTEIVVTHTLVV